MKDNLLIVELNEFNTELLKKGAEYLKLGNIKKILEFKHSETISDANLERQGLDPWVQWVSVHTGKPSSEHKVIRIGEIPKQKFSQIWETLGENGISTGIWGPMNASMNRTKNCKFFLPDPWTFTQNGYPETLNLYLELPRYYSKNYIAPSKRRLIKGLFKMLNFFLSPKLFISSFKELFNIVILITKNGLKNITLFTIFDLLNTIAFLEYKKASNPNFSIIFLNSLAHLQHHHWQDEMNSEMKMCLQIIDKIFGKLIKEKKNNESMIVLNALSQRNIFKKGVFIYRQKDSIKLLKTINLKFKKVEEGMTNDGHIFFNSNEELNISYEILSNAKIKEESLFFIEKDPLIKNRLFYQLNIQREILYHETFEINNQSLRFFDYFVLLRERTGEHIVKGNIYSEKIEFPKKLKNHEINYHILKNFNIDKKYF